MIANKLLTPPLVEPVTLAEMKAHAKIMDDADDALLDGLIVAARQWCEGYTGRAFIAQTWTQSVKGRPKDDTFGLGRPPLISVQSVKTYDADNQCTVLDSKNYFVDNSADPAFLVLLGRATWACFEGASRLEITYVSGYGLSASAVPEAIKLAIKQLALHWYEHRGESIVEGACAKVPLVIESVLQPYRLVRLGGA